MPADTYIQPPVRIRDRTLRALDSRWKQEEIMEFATYPSLKNRTAFVTGGASGIGADIVRAFAVQGSQVGFVDIDAFALRERLAG